MLLTLIKLQCKHPVIYLAYVGFTSRPDNHSSLAAASVTTKPGSDQECNKYYVCGLRSKRQDEEKILTVDEEEQDATEDVTQLSQVLTRN